MMMMIVRSLKTCYFIYCTSSPNHPNVASEYWQTSHCARWTHNSTCSQRYSSCKCCVEYSSGWRCRLGLLAGAAGIQLKRKTAAISSLQNTGARLSVMGAPCRDHITPIHHSNSTQPTLVCDVAENRLQGCSLEWRRSCVVRIYS